MCYFLFLPQGVNRHDGGCEKEGELRNHRPDHREQCEHVLPADAGCAHAVLRPVVPTAVLPAAAVGLPAAARPLPAPPAPVAAVPQLLLDPNCTEITHLT